MKLQLTSLLFLITFQSFGQIRSNPSQVGMGYGSYTHKSQIQNSAQDINRIISNPVDFSNHTEGEWFSANRRIRNYDAHWLKRVKLSKNLRKELYIGGKISGQFQHRTLFIGTAETLEEETIVDQKTGAMRLTSSFQTDAYAELNDFINVSPNVFYRIILNDFLSVNTSVAAGLLVPLRAGIQKSSFTGSVTRLVEGETVISEYKMYNGELTFDWHKAKFEPKFRFESSVSLELKPSAKKPYYVSVGVLLGHHLNALRADSFRYTGMHLDIQSQF